MATMIPRNPAAKPAAAAAADKAAETTTDNAAAPAAAAATSAASPAPAASTSTAVTVAATTAVSIRVNGKPEDVIARLYKDALPLEWNTLHRIQCNQGSFLDLEDSKKSIGDVIELELMSYQDSWVVSPGADGAEAAALVRYSRDGKTLEDGTPIPDYVNGLIEAGWEKAKCSPRVVIAGILLSSSKPCSIIDSMVQMDLSTTSKQMFDRFRFQVSFDVSRGKFTQPEDALRFLKLTATPESKGDKSWTKAVFEYGTVPA